MMDNHKLAKLIAEVATSLYNLAVELDEECLSSEFDDEFIEDIFDILDDDYGEVDLDNIVEIMDGR